MTATEERPAVFERGGAPGSVGVVVPGCCAVWALISAAAGNGRPEGVLLAVLAVVAGYACGRISGSLVPVGTAVCGALTLLAAAPVAANAHRGEVAALLALASGAACCAARAVRAGPWAWPLRLLVVAVVAEAAALGSPAGCAAAVVVTVCALAVRDRAGGRARGTVLVAFGLVAAVAVGGAWAVARGGLPPVGAVSAQRVALWREATDIAAAHPVLGAGPDRFGDLSGSAAVPGTPDAGPHSAALQMAAEQGVVGLALLACGYGWLLYGLARSPCATPVAVAAGAALTSLAVLAAVSDALSFAPVTAAAGALAGLATANRAGTTPHG
ncbi:O-antigen ligase family protein [Streptomyces sp. 8L]|uniref:O-antigen ligase family protein n=1 Tax=Streptomyces sp. 8L TaxID=2877242 RepID=UPI001CD76F73|nr:O-antigen ligase family protein [Streptomyces sp. 8L]MCA1220835.1 O-antigen ligase family protein [Streptomyces sp. 8L]